MNFSIQSIANQALASGFLAAEMEFLINQAYDNCLSLTIEDYLALDQLMEAMLAGQVILAKQKHHINVMEGLVVNQVISHLSQLPLSQSKSLNIGDIAAYALNRLPPLYATSTVGQSFQQAYAQEHLEPVIAEQVEKALDRSLKQPNNSPERQPLQQQLGNQDSLLTQITTLLQHHAPSSMSSSTSSSIHCQLTQ